MANVRLALGFVAVLTASASADIRVYNATQSKLKVDATLPNGEVKSVTLDEAVDSLDSDGFTFAAGVKTVKVSIADDSGKSVWSGSLGSNEVGVVIPAGKGAAFIPAGTYSGDFSVPRSAAFLNVTGDAMTLDLVGRNGLAAHRGLAMGTTGFDPKQVVKLDPRESTFGLRLTLKGKPPADIEGTVDPQRYYLLWKRSRDGEYRMTNLGYLPAPPKKK
jgi:hypothetical protein